jgi:predicted DCC family thiol-disulfide oxidoreductase YuxK
MAKPDPERIVFFDGVCNFCNLTVDFLFKNNSRRNLMYSPLQSGFAKHFLFERQIQDTTLHTVYYYTCGRVHKKSAAILRLCAQLKGLYPVLVVFLAIPPFLRDPVYDLIAKNRYRLFGKRDACRIPTPDQKKYFIEDTPATPTSGQESS